jgi:hypothetical protein
MVTHNLADGVLYSSVASHPQAPAKVLNSIYKSIYGEPSAPAQRRQIAKHAYQPPYGRTDPALPDMGTGNSAQMGVTTLIPMQEGNVASVSPSGVRVHAIGGLQMADHHMEGMLAGTPHPNSVQSGHVTFLTVGGMALGKSSDGGIMGSEQHLHSMDLWQGLRIVTSHSLDRNTRQGGTSSKIAVTALATSHSRGCIAAGCSDGYLRLVDNRNRDMAKIKSHMGGVVDVAVSQDGSLVATTGYGSSALRSQGSPLYGFPDPTILINDIRYLGRGGFPHPFAGLRGGPRFVSFLPEMEGQPSNRLLVGSGQAGGGLQIIAPFQDDAESTNFILPPLDQGESITCLCVSEDKLALGSSRGRVLQYQMAGYQPKTSLLDSIATHGTFIPSRGIGAGLSVGSRNKSTDVVKVEKLPLVVPPFQPRPPPVSIDANILLKEDHASRLGRTDNIKSIFGTYLLTKDPLVSALGDPSERSFNWFRPWVTSPILAQSSLLVSSSLKDKASHTVDFMQTVPTSDLGIDVFDDHRPKKIKDRERKKKAPLQNPNKFLYTNDLYKLSYEESLNRAKRYGHRGRRDGKHSGSDSEDGDLLKIPNRYRLMLRPTHRLAASFNHAEYNQTGLIPGFDYPITMPNAFVPPVLLLLFFIPELREAALNAQFGPALVSARDRSLVSEIGFLFHRIESIARFGMLFAAPAGVSSMTRLDAWAPSAVISLLTTMPEAERFQILDGSPAALDSPRRPESFYRFLMYQIENELGGDEPTAMGLLDSLSGTDFVW